MAFHGGSIQRVGASSSRRAELVVEHPFPGIELEGEFDVAIVEIDEAAIVAPADVLDVDHGRIEAGLPCGVLEIGERAGILGVFGGSGQMQVTAERRVSSSLDQPLMDRVELVGASGNDAPLDRLLEPGPLKHRGLEDRGRGIRVVFQQFCRPAPVETEIEPAVEAGFVAVPAFARSAARTPPGSSTGADISRHRSRGRPVRGTSRRSRLSAPRSDVRSHRA